MSTFLGEVHYTNHPQERIKGDLTIKDGYLDNVRFFVWLAELFSIPSLKRVNFKSIVSEFDVTDRYAKIDNVKLTSDQILLTGTFSLKENELLSSKISLLLSRKFLATSPKFKLLLGLISRKISSLGFNFQLSGFYNAPNFKWLESEFKQKIKKILPGFMERGLERKIERAIKSISK